jgi:hypothetical protein
VSGDRLEHLHLEAASAELVGADQALVFSSGYAANVGLLSALAGPDDLIVSDALNHASIIDGIRLSRAKVAIVPHLDLGATEKALHGHHARRAFVVTESYFSMDADWPACAVSATNTAPLWWSMRPMRSVSWARGDAASVLKPTSTRTPWWAPLAKRSEPAGRSWRDARRSSTGYGTARDRSYSRLA